VPSARSGTRYPRASMTVDSPESRGPTELATDERGRPVVTPRPEGTVAAKQGATPKANATAVGKKGATPKPERPPEPTRDGKKDEGSIPLGEVIGGRYRLVSHIGAGGQGEVWRAEDVEISGHVVALKMLFARAGTEADRDFQLRELRMLASVSHPSVVQFKDHGWLGGRMWFVMPWYEGKDLEKSLPLERVEARRIFEQIAAGLAAVHAKGLRHQDIKPGNVFLAKIDGLEDTLPILLDFGVAATESEILVAGSPAYFAPELAAGWPHPSADVGPPADVFALALALRIALDPEGVPEVGAFDRPSLERRAKEPITPPSGPGLAYLAPHFARWLSLDPKARPTAAELVKELAVLTEPEEQSKERRKTLRRVAPWAALVAALALVGGWWGWEQVVTARKQQADEATERMEAEALAQSQAERAQQLGGQLDDALARADASSRRTTEALGRLDEAEEAIASAQGNAEQLRVARDRLRLALEAAHAEVTASETALADAQTAITRLGTELSDARRRIEEQRGQLETLRTERDGLASERDRLRADLEARRQELAARASDLDAARSELEGLRAAQQASTTAQQALERDREALRSTLEAQRAATSAAEARASAAERRASAAEAEAAQLRAAADRRPSGPTTTTPQEPPTIPDAPITAPAAHSIGMATVRPRTEADGVPGDPTP